ncbi:alkyl sulfatase dimerization domain-containing protein [Microbacterium sp. NPDC064584]|uniref:alkyl/aryl-sulfatase n=1 Tax=Microbacterium sp. NPDC064584 TaxID=3155817 RepID=UPI00343F839C
MARSDHFHPHGTAPSAATTAAQQRARESLPFTDRRDFDEVTRGFIARPTVTRIMADAGNVAWDFGAYSFLTESDEFDSIHPSLQRQAVLNAHYGLFEVVPDRVWQVRGFDLANVSFIKSDTGWIVFDPLTTRETAAAALALVTEHLGERPVVAVVFSHSHGDHFGGVRGVIDEADVVSGAVQVIAPAGFLEHAVAENVYAGNAMSRRLFYQYGALLEPSPFGHVDQAIGKKVAAGSIGLIAPTMSIEDDFEEHVIDGVRMVFQNTPGTEAPAEMNTWFPDLKAFWAAENITATIHNIYTLRGALVRDALEWSRQINAALYRFGGEAEVMFASHSWPRWGNERIQEVMRAQRDTYAHLNNTVLHLANQGVTINEIHNVYRVPESLQRQWTARSYHGSVPHNARAVVNRYLGYWDANPTTLIPLSPKDSAPLYVELMGGAGPILAKARELISEGEYFLATEILNKLLYAEPGEEDARMLLAQAFEQIGYQQESPSLRNSFLAGALELRSGLPSGVTPTATGPDLVRALTTVQFFDFLAIRLDPAKAETLSFVANLTTPDTGQRFVIELSNGALTTLEGAAAADPDVSVTIDRAHLERAMTGEVSLAAMLTDGSAHLDGDGSVLARLGEMLVDFPLGFEVLPGTPGAVAVPGR